MIKLCIAEPSLFGTVQKLQGDILTFSVVLLLWPFIGDRQEDNMLGSLGRVVWEVDLHGEIMDASWGC